MTHYEETEIGRVLVNDDFRGATERQDIKELFGYDFNSLRKVAMLLECNFITPEMLKDGFEMYCKGFKDGQALEVKMIEDTVNSFNQTFEVGKFGESLDMFKQFYAKPLDSSKVIKID